MAEKENGLIIEGLEFVAATELARTWKSTGVKADPDGPELELEVLLVPVRQYKRAVNRVNRKREKLGENAPARLHEQLDAELEETIHDLCLVGWRGATLANLTSILRANKVFNRDNPKFREMLKSRQEIPFEALVPNADGGAPIRLSKYMYSNAFPSKFANIVVTAVTEGGVAEEDAADLGKDDFED